MKMERALFFFLGVSWPTLRVRRERERNLVNEASLGSLVVLWPKFVQKSTKNGAHARAFRVRFLSGSFHLYTKPLMHFL